VVVAVGLTLREFVPDEDVKVPGVMAMLVAPETIQFRLVLEPVVMLAGSAVKEAMVGADPAIGGGVVEPQPVSPAPTNRKMTASAARPRIAELGLPSALCWAPLAMYVAPWSNCIRSEIRLLAQEILPARRT